jgi:L-amino acid N-acyltransferase YncA
MSSPAVVRMTADDGAAVLRIYDEGIANGLATFTSNAPNWEDWDREHLDECRWVARDGDEVLGWAALSPYSDCCSYGGVAELSVYVAAAARGRGVGKVLLQRLVTSSEDAGYWTLQAGVIVGNEASIRLHHACGFRTVGTRERIGQAAGVWHDVVLLERRSEVVGT